MFVLGFLVGVVVGAILSAQVKPAILWVWTKIKGLFKAKSV